MNSTTMNPPRKNSPSKLGACRQRPSTRHGDETRQVDAIVFAVVPEFHQVKIRDGEGHVYAITRKTSGIDLLTLREGQVVRCKVTLKLPRVLSAEAVT